MKRHGVSVVPAGTSTVRSPGRIIIISAGVAAGHDGAAAAWAHEFATQGHPVDVYDLLDLLPAPMRLGLRGLYRSMLRRLPWTYGFVFRLGDLPWGADRAARLLLKPYVRRVARLVTPDTVAVVSTYPLASQVLGMLRRSGRLLVPTATVLTDFAVHRQWVAPGIDTHYALHEVSAAQARRWGAAGVVVAGAKVARGFAPASVVAARAAREKFRLPADAKIALLTCGSWGVGAVVRAAREIAESGAAVPVVVCGSNEALRRRLASIPGCHALGWVDDMPTLMHAAHVLVENSGGLTSLEAMASGVAVATYRPIPGHGHLNARMMERAGVSRWVRRRAELGPVLDQLLQGPRGKRQRAAGSELFRRPATPLPEASSTAPARPLVRRRLSVTAAVGAVVVGLVATLGTHMAVARGLDTARPESTGQLFVVVRLSATRPVDARTIAILDRLHAAVALDTAFLARRPNAVRRLVAADVPLVNAGGVLAARNRARTITRLAPDRRPIFLLSAGRVNAVDLAASSFLDETIVRPAVQSSCGTPPELTRGTIVLVACADGLTGTLRALAAEIAERGIHLGSLQELDS